MRKKENEKDLWEFEQDFMFCARNERERDREKERKKFKYTFKINSFACVILEAKGAKICHFM